MYIRASLAVIGDDLRAVRDVCIAVNDEGVVESVEGWGSCPWDSAGGTWAAVLPQPANAHVHSADGRFPEFGVSLGLHELVAPPDGLKYRLLSTLGPAETAVGIWRTYRAAYELGVGLLVDFREGGGLGCLAAQRARSMVPDMDVLVLGTPGPSFPSWCQGLGLSSPLDYSEGVLRQLTSQLSPSFTHVAEDPENRREGDLEVALRAGFTALVHGTHLSGEDVQALAERKVPLVMCPRSNMWHGLRLPPVAEAIRAGVTLGLGSDNAAWNLPDPWGEAEEAMLIARSQGLREAPEAILRALMVGGYRAAGLEPRTIEEGRRLHAVIVDAYSTGILSALDVATAVVRRARAGLALRADGSHLAYLSKAGIY